MKEVGSQQKGGDHATNKIAMKYLPFKKRKPYLTSAAAALAVSNIAAYDQQPSCTPLLRYSPSSSPSCTPLLRYSPSSSPSSLPSVCSPEFIPSPSSSPSSLPSVCSPEFIPYSATSPRSCTPSTLFFNSPYKYNPMLAEYISEYSPEYTPLSPHVGSYIPLSTDFDVPWTPTPRSTPTSLSLDFDITALLSPNDTLWTPTALTQEYASPSPVGTSLSLDLDILRTPTHSSSFVGSIENTQLYPKGTPWTPTALTQEYVPSLPVGTRGFDTPWTPTPLSSHVGSVEYTRLYPGGTPLTPEYMDTERSKEYDTPITLWLFDH